MFYHFEYASGANPYIALNEKERDRIRRRHTRRGEKVTRIQTTATAIFYKVADKAPESVTA